MHVHMQCNGPYHIPPQCDHTEFERFDNTYSVPRDCDRYVLKLRTVGTVLLRTEYTILLSFDSATIRVPVCYPAHSSRFRFPFVPPWLAAPIPVEGLLAN